MGSSSALDGLFASQSTAQSAPASTPVPKDDDPKASVSGVSALDTLFGDKHEAPPPIAPAQTGSTLDSLFKRDNVNPLTSLSSDERAQSARPDPENQTDEPWYSKTWDWMNKPLWDLHQYGTRTGAGSFERGVESGAEDVVSGMTSPLSIALSVPLAEYGLAKAGLTGAAATVGKVSSAPLIAALRPFVSAEVAPLMANGIKSLVNLGFTGQQVYQLTTQVPELMDAFKDGDIERATRIATGATATGVMAGLGASKVGEDIGNVVTGAKAPSQAENLKIAKKAGGDYNLNVKLASEQGQDIAKQFLDEAKTKGLNNKEDLQKIAVLVETNNNRDLIRAQRDALAGTLQTKQTPELAAMELNPTIKDFGSKQNYDSFVKQNEPPVKNGFTRLYRGEGTEKAALPDWAKDNAGQWFTSQRSKAESFSNERQGKLNFVDVPNTDLEAYNAGSGNASNEYLLPEVVQKNRGIQNVSGYAHQSLANQFDVASYTDENGKRVTVPLKPINQIPTKPEWDDQYLYHATDKSRAEAIRNSGVGKRGGSTSWYANTPEEALKAGVTPVSGNRADLRVFAVPRDEVETGAKGFTPDKADIGSQNKDFTATNKVHMPSHEVVLDENGKPTGQAISLRPDNPQNLTLDNARFQSQYTPAEKAELLKAYDGALDAAPEHVEFARRLREFYEKEMENANANGMIRQGVENYHPAAYAQTRPGVLESLFGLTHNADDNSAFQQLRHQNDNGRFDTDVTAAKHRAFETQFQARMAGFKDLVSDHWDMIHQAADYHYKMEKALAARKFLSDLSAAKGADGTPLTALEGSSKILGAESKNPALGVFPNAIRDIIIPHPDAMNMQQTGDLERLVNAGKIDKLPFTRQVKDPETGEKIEAPAYAWNTEHYRNIDSPHMKDWQYLGRDTAGNPAIMKAAMRVHPDVEQYIRQVVGADPSWFRPTGNNPSAIARRGAMAAQREAKGTLLSFSPFHAAQSVLRGVMSAIGSIGNADAMRQWGKDWSWDPIRVEGKPLDERLVRNTLTLSDSKIQDMANEGNIGHSKYLGKVPVLGHIQNFINSFTFEHLIPQLKLHAARSEYYRLQKLMPEASADQVAHAAASKINDVFGGQNWRDLGVSNNAQDAMRAFMLAPDWLTSELRSLYRASGGMDKATAVTMRQDMARLGVAMYAGARVVNLLATGKTHPEAPFGLVIPGKNGADDKVYSLRTLPTDLMHAISDPRGFIAGRVNPLFVRPAVEGLTGRDEFGRKVTGGEEAEDAVKNIIPIGAQGLLRGKVPGGLTNLDQLAKAAGTTVVKYNTEAERLAQDIASDHTPQGAVSPDDLEKHRKTLVAEDQLRNKNITRGQIMREFPQREANQIIQNSAQTPLQARFQRLPLRDALNVWDVATNSEKAQLHKELWNKRLSYITTHTAAQRNNDPVWQRMQSVYGDLKAPATPAPITANPFESVLKGDK